MSLFKGITRNYDEILDEFRFSVLLSLSKHNNSCNSYIQPQCVATNITTRSPHVAAAFFGSWLPLSSPRNFLSFTVPAGSVPCLQNPQTLPHSQPDDSIPV